MRQARHPDWNTREDALKYLLSIDKAISYDSKIAFLFIQESLKLPYGKMELLANWLRSPPTTPRLGISIIYSLWALIHLACERMGKLIPEIDVTGNSIGALTHEDIYDLFVAIHRDRNGMLAFELGDFSHDMKRTVRRHKKTLSRLIP